MQQVAAAPVQQVAAAPVQQVAAAPVQQVAAAPVQQVVAAPVQQVVAAPVQQVLTDVPQVPTIEAPPAPPLPATQRALMGGGQDPHQRLRMDEAISLLMEQERETIQYVPPQAGSLASSSPQPTSKRTRRSFTETEIAMLRTGVQRHGAGNWVQILRDPELSFHDSRSPNSLKDKWRHMQKKKQSAR